MKKLVTLVSILTIGLSTFAQEETTTNKPLRFGIKASPTLSWLKAKSNDLEGDGSSLGFSYGLMADFSIGDNYAFSTGLDVSHKGGKLAYTDKKGQFLNPITLAYTDSTLNTNQAYFKNADYSIQHLEIPLTIKMHTKEIGYLTYYAQAGVAPSITIGAKYNKIRYREKDDTLLYEDTDANAITDINTFGLAMIVGAGIEYSISGDTKIMMGVTFNNGFTDILDQNKKEYKDYNEKASANFIALNIGVFF